MKFLVFWVAFLVVQFVQSVPVVNNEGHVEVTSTPVEAQAKVEIVHEGVPTLPAKVGIVPVKGQTLPAKVPLIPKGFDQINPLFWQWLSDHIDYYLGFLPPPNRRRILDPYSGPNRILDPYYGPERYNRIVDPYFSRILDPYYINMRNSGHGEWRVPIELREAIRYSLNGLPAGRFSWHEQRKAPSVKRTGEYYEDPEEEEVRMLEEEEEEIEGPGGFDEIPGGEEGPGGFDEIPGGEEGPGGFDEIPDDEEGPGGFGEIPGGKGGKGKGVPGGHDQVPGGKVESGKETPGDKGEHGKETPSGKGDNTGKVGTK